MRGGSIIQVLRTDAVEQKFSVQVSRLDDVLSGLRDKIRFGERLTGFELESLI